MKILGIEIERKTDILAMAAFLISAGSLISQLAQIMQGPEVKLDGPRQIALLFKPSSDGHNHLHAITNHHYINKGAPGHDDILKSESLMIKIGTRVIKLAGEYSLTLDSQGNKLMISDKDLWKPDKVEAGNFINRETLYKPRTNTSTSSRRQNFIGKQELTDLLRTNKTIDITLKAETYSGPALESSCRILSSDVLTGFETKGWSSPVCQKTTMDQED